MSLFYRNFNDFSPLLRLADELDRAARAPTRQGTTRSFAPRFDVKETQETYELHGELPGIQQSNVNIEWTDDNTLIISGHTEKIHEPKSPDVNQIAQDSATNYQKPTVEEDGESSNDNAIAESSNENNAAKVSEVNASRYWITERSTGSFSRSFQFPARVDHDTVKASLKNGVLHLTVPKAKARAPRKITIQ